VTGYEWALGMLALKYAGVEGRRGTEREDVEVKRENVVGHATG
jgi:hypothetical protein